MGNSAQCFGTNLYGRPPIPGRTFRPDGVLFKFNFEVQMNVRVRRHTRRFTLKFGQLIFFVLMADSETLREEWQSIQLGKRLWEPNLEHPFVDWRFQPAHPS